MVSNKLNYSNKCIWFNSRLFLSHPVFVCLCLSLYVYHDNKSGPKSQISVSLSVLLCLPVSLFVSLCLSLSIFPFFISITRSTKVSVSELVLQRLKESPPPYNGFQFQSHKVDQNCLYLYLLIFPRTRL